MLFRFCHRLLLLSCFRLIDRIVGYGFEDFVAIACQFSGEIKAGPGFYILLELLFAPANLAENIEKKVFVRRP